jgi:AcrR family transcriptional regulator
MSIRPTGVLDLPQLVRGLPPAPPAELDAALDAASRCFARHGITRTSMTDIGRDLGVSRSTIYRMLGSVEQAVRLLTAREVNQLVAGRLAAAVRSATGPETIIVLLDEIVTYVRHHPVLVKVVADEPEIIGPLVVTELPATTAQVAALIEPLLVQAMDGGLIARQDAAALAGWLVRIACILIVDPPAQPLRPLLDQLLRPVLDPSRGR